MTQSTKQILTYSAIGVGVIAVGYLVYRAYQNQNAAAAKECIDNCDVCYKKDANCNCVEITDTVYCQQFLHPGNSQSVSTTPSVTPVPTLNPNGVSNQGVTSASIVNPQH